MEGWRLTIRRLTIRLLTCFFKEYESRIESLQRQVDLAQSMISSSGCSTWDGGGGDFIFSKSLMAETESKKLLN